MENEKSENEAKSNIEKRLAALEEKFKLVNLQSGLVTHPAIRFPLGAEMLSACSIIGPVVYPPIVYDVLTSMLPIHKSGVKEVVIDADPSGPAIVGFSVSTGFTTLPETHPLTGEPNNPVKITVTFLDGSSQEHTVQPGGKWKLKEGDFTLFKLA